MYQKELFKTSHKHSDIKIQQFQVQDNKSFSSTFTKKSNVDDFLEFKSLFRKLPKTTSIQNKIRSKKILN